MTLYTPLRALAEKVIAARQTIQFGANATSDFRAALSPEVVIGILDRVEKLEAALTEAIEHVHAITKADHNERAADTAVSNWKRALAT